MEKPGADFAIVTVRIRLGEGTNTGPCENYVGDRTT
jgi:hypothetical protein